MNFLAFFKERDYWRTYLLDGVLSIDIVQIKQIARRRGEQVSLKKMTAKACLPAKPTWQKKVQQLQRHLRAPE